MPYKAQLYNIGDVLVIDNKRYEVVEMKRGEERCSFCPLKHEDYCNKKLNSIVGYNFIQYRCSYILGWCNRLQLVNNVKEWGKMIGGKNGR